MIVTIDGPAGAGKSSVARELAKRLGFQFLDTGAMYRAVAWAGLQADVDLQDEAALANVAQDLRIRFDKNQVWADDCDVSQAIRSPEVTQAVRFAAGNSRIRYLLVEQQRQIGATVDNLVTEGRDQGSVVFPQAACKIFLTATPEERARRRYKELLCKGEIVTFHEVLESQNQRDQSDAARELAPLMKPEGAIEIYTDGMTEEQVIQHLAWIVETTRNQAGP